MRGLLWFEPGELRSILHDIGSSKPTYEARWEGAVLSALAFGCIAAFALNSVAGLAVLFFVKLAVQALHKKHFFRAIDEAGLHPNSRAASRRSLAVAAANARRRP